MSGASSTHSRGRREPVGGVSLFPFLAVLICTMGVLILLLVVIARQARLQAAERAGKQEVVRDERGERIRGEIRMAEWMASQFEESHRKTEADLTDVRTRLGQIEDHTGELRRRLAEIQEAWKQLDALQAGGEAKREELQSKLAELTSRIREREAELEEVRQSAATQKPAYSVVPYRGPHGTHRRPIYLECRAESIVLQPEGIVFGEGDFNGPLDSGNPLDVGLRAVREYLVEQRGRLGAGSAEEPYPLLLVRPSGIGAYYAARAAMQSWGAEFGYELIGDDWELEFFPADPHLARAVAEAVEPARRRQQMAIAAAPSRYGSGGSDRSVYTVQPYRGGVTRRSGPEGGGNEGLTSSGVSGPFGSQIGSAGSAGQGDRGKGGDGSVSGDRFAAGGQGAEQAGQREEDPSAAGAVGQSTESLAKARGRNWGLPDATRSAVPITRPIRIECWDDRLTLVPEAGLGAPQTLALEGGVRPSIDSFVSAVWDYMETWGKAGRAMYWRPILNVYVGPGADRHFHQLESLLKDSGLEVHQAGRLTPSP